MNKLSDKVYDYIADTQNYDMDELLEGLIENIPKMRPHGKYTHPVSLDECCVYWGDDHYLMGLDDYTKEIFKKTCELVINVIKSFEEEHENV